MAVPSNSTRGAVSTTRRKLIAAGGGAAAVAALATPAAASDPLEPLWEQYERLRAELAVADEAYWNALHQRPEPPACLFARVHPVGAKPYLRPLDPEELQKEFDAAVVRRGTAWAVRNFAPALQAVKEWRAACEASDVRHRVAELDAKADALFQRSNAVAEQILATPPRSLRGVMVWLQLMEHHMSAAPPEPENEWTLDERVMRRLLPAVRAIC